MRRAATFLTSSIGLKAVMAVSGLVLYGFVVAHMTGNLQVYLGADALDRYGAFLREVLHGAGLWIARAVLLASVVAHVWAAVVLTQRNWAARPRGYRRWQARESTYASRTMVWSGPLLALFIGYHLAHLTLGVTDPRFVEGRVYANLVLGFQNPFVAGFYMLATLALGLHMYHGFWSLLQTLGLSHPRYDALRRRAALALAGVVVAGNLSIPLSVLSGLVHL